MYFTIKKKKTRKKSLKFSGTCPKGIQQTGKIFSQENMINLDKKGKNLWY